MVTVTNMASGKSRGRGERATMRDIAARAGVSAMTVSRVLCNTSNASACASEETAQKILDAADELNTIPVHPRFQNKHSATRVVGVVLDEVEGVKSFVGSHTFEGLRDEAIRRGFDLLLHAGCGSARGAANKSANKSARVNEVLGREEAAFLDRRSDGVIFISPRERRGVLEALVQHGFPVVSCFSCDVPEGVATIVPDNARAMQCAVGYLYGRGHRRIAYFAGPDWHSDARERRAAWVEAMHVAGLEAQAGCIESSEGETARHTTAARRILSRRPTAVVCHNDYRALLLEEAARARGLDVPRELSILGMDDLPEAGQHGLSTLRLDFEAAGRAAVQAVIAMIEGAGADEVSRRLHAPLIERRSVATAAVAVAAAQAGDI